MVNWFPNREEFGPLPTLSGHAISNSAFPQGTPCRVQNLPGKFVGTVH